MSSSAVLKVDGIGKSFNRFKALNGVSLEVEPGTVFSLLGQNGAGKTTLIKILLGILKASSGSAEVLGHAAGSVTSRARIGYLPEDHRFPEYHTGPSLLDFYGGLAGIGRQERKKKVGFWMDRVGLAGREKVRIRGYSKGMKQRIGLAQAFFHDPDLVFLDEPTDGVDPVGRREIRDLMLEMKQQGKTIFLNSHLLGEVERISDRVAILNKGSLIRMGSVAELTDSGIGWKLGFLSEPLPFLEALKAASVQATVKVDKHLQPPFQVDISLGKDADIAPWIQAAAADPAGLRLLQQTRDSLEDVYLKSVEASADKGKAKRPKLPVPNLPANGAN